jgi:hypothetical protein
MMIAIHQPECLPWLGYFDKMANVNTYVLFDHVQFKKRYYENRNVIKQGDKPVWITVPVKSKGRYTQAIKEVEIDNTLPWQRKTWETIRHCYASSPFYKQYHEELHALMFHKTYELLLDFNLACIEWFRKTLGITTPMLFSSSLDVDSFKASDLILEICRRTGADKYLCGPSGKEYLHLENFKNAGIEVVWQDFTHPSYPQEGKGFIPNLSTIDLIFNCGAESKSILFNKKQHIKMPIPG